jgi:hypothetical protein
MKSTIRLWQKDPNGWSQMTKTLETARLYDLALRAWVIGGALYAPLRKYLKIFLSKCF